MEFFLSDELIERVKEHLKKTQDGRPMRAFIEEAVDVLIENYPWFPGDICVHCEECMHHKSVEEWKEDAHE